MESSPNIRLATLAAALERHAGLVLEIAEILGIEPKPIGGRLFFSASDAGKITEAIHRSLRATSRHRAYSQFLNN